MLFRSLPLVCFNQRPPRSLSVPIPPPRPASIPPFPDTLFHLFPGLFAGIAHLFCVLHSGFRHSLHYCGSLRTTNPRGKEKEQKDTPPASITQTSANSVVFSFSLFLIRCSHLSPLSLLALDRILLRASRAITLCQYPPVSPLFVELPSLREAPSLR